MYDKETTFEIVETRLLDSTTLEKLAGDSDNTLDPEFLYLWVRAISSGEYWGCFPSGQCVLMGDGSYKNIENIEPGEYVYTPYGNIKRVLVKYSRHYTGELNKFSFAGTPNNIICTPNHPILTLNKSDICCLHDKYVRHIPKFSGTRGICKRKQSRDCLNKVYPQYQPRFRDSQVLDVGDYAAYVPFHSPADILSKEFMYLLGIYLAEGSVDYHKLKDGTRVPSCLRLSLHSAEEFTIVPIVRECLQYLGGKISGIYKDKRCSAISVLFRCDTLMAFVLKHNITTALYKYIPKMLFTPNSNYLLQGLLDGDGTVDKFKRNIINTISPSLARDIYDLLVLNDYSPVLCKHVSLVAEHHDVFFISFASNITPLANFGIKGTINTSDKCQSFIFEKKQFVRIKSISPVLFDDVVYNLEVDGDSAYIVNGIAVHNCNKNSDWFSEMELTKSYSTFMEAHVFKNHDNKDVAKAIGQVLQSEFNPDMHCVELLLRIDRVLAPEIVRAFEKGYSTDVSMGCRVNHTVCSICGNVARTREDFCEHVRFKRGQVMPDGKKVVEYNIGPRFHDISIVLNGADRTAKVLELVNSSVNVAPINKAATLESSLLEKVASVKETTLTSRPSLQKLADIQKQVSDSLYVLALLDRIGKHNLSEEDVAEFADDMKEAGVYLDTGLEKQAGPYKRMRNLAIGVTGMALATNYYQGKRMRGEDMNSIQNFVADNPGTLPIAYVLSRPFIRKGIRAAKKSIKPSLEAFASSFENGEYLSKFAAVNDDADEYINIFTSPEVANYYKTAYHVNDDKLSMVKLALTLKAAKDYGTVDAIKLANDMTDSDLSNFIQSGYSVINSVLDKEASFIGNAVSSGLFTNTHTKGINPGLAAGGIAGAMIDGVLLTNLLTPKKHSTPPEVPTSTQESKIITQ